MIRDGITREKEVKAQLEKLKGREEKEAMPSGNAEKPC